MVYQGAVALSTDCQWNHRRYNLYIHFQLINYIRAHKSQPAELMAAVQPLWTDDKYLRPAEFENWLTFDYDTLESSPAAKSQYAVKTERQQIEELLVQLQQKNELLAEAAGDIEQLRSKLRELFDQPAAATGTSTAAALSDGGGDHQVAENSCTVSSVPVDQDSGYFSSYAHYGIHHEMLSDEVRTSSYRDAIVRNGPTIRDAVVLDLGCGTSILSMFASRTGARRVIAVDQSDIIYKAMDIVRHNDITNIEFVKGRLEDTQLPVDRVDIIVSEWMGYFLLFEGMLDSVIYARNRYLAPGGRLLPNRCTISVVGLGDEQRYAQMIAFWDRVYGFDMRTMRDEVLPEASVEICAAEHVLTGAQLISDLDLMTVSESCMNFESPLELRVLRAGKLTALAGYFDTFFELPEPVEFSTGPAAPATHWKQTVFYLPEPVTVAAGEVVRGHFTCRRDRKDVRALFVQVELFGKKLKYYLN